MTGKSWQEFRDSGLLFIVNQLLHIFGWAIVFEWEDYEKSKTTEPDRIYPARVKFRGFDEKSTTNGYVNISKYMVDNAEELYWEIL